MKTFRRRPGEIRAIQHDGSIEMMEKICALFPEHFGIASNDGEQLVGPVLCHFPEKQVTDPVHGVFESDWVIEGVDGIPYICKADVFEQLYDEVVR